MSLRINLNIVKRKCYFPKSMYSIAIIQNKQCTLSYEILLYYEIRANIFVLTYTLDIIIIITA